MKRWENKQPHSSGFTIVELLIVVVVIAILAAITLVAYNGIRERTQQSQVQTTLSQANKKILAYAADNADMHPSSLQAAGVPATSDVAFEYSFDNANTSRRYAITASNGTAGQFRYFISSAKAQVQQGIAPGHNLVPWDKAKDDTAPVRESGVAIDTAVFRTSTASLRFAPGATGRALANIPYSGTPGQVVTVKLWLRSDANWNGTGDNSKVRFGRVSDGSLLAACGYNGVKTAWTEVTCPFTLTSADSSVNVSVGNNGTVGNIWIDDLHVSVQ